jgi:hypothetical protein
VCICPSALCRVRLVWRVVDRVEAYIFNMAVVEHAAAAAACESRERREEAYAYTDHTNPTLALDTCLRRQHEAAMLRLAAAPQKPGS